MDKKVLKWNFIFQYGYVITNMINAILLLPFYLKYINEEILGLWWATGNVLAWLTMSDPGIGDVLQQKLAVLLGKKDYVEINKTINSGLVASLLSFALAIVVGVVFYLFLDEILNVGDQGMNELGNAFFISILATALTLLTFALAGINQGLLKAKEVAISYITSNLLYFIVNVVLLILNFGLMSIAISNVVRALYLTLFNGFVVYKQHRSMNMENTFYKDHFLKFIRVFSYTATSKVIASFSSSLDLVVLARYIPPQLITVFEINRRPIKMLQGLVGRYSVALMPSVSHISGINRELVVENIKKQFDLYFIVTVFITSVSYLTYRELIVLWTDTTKYSGDLVMILLLFTFFFSIIGYFFSNMTYATGDIRNNSLVNIIKGLVLIVALPFSAKNHGIIGVLYVTLFVTVVLEFGSFVFRLIKLNYFVVDASNVINWIKIILVTLVVTLIVKIIFDKYYFDVLIMNIGMKSILFLIMFTLAMLIVSKENLFKIIRLR